MSARTSSCPEHRTIPAVGFSNEPSPGWGTHANPLYAGALFTLLFFEIGAVAVGVARGAIDVYEDVLRNKPIDIPPFTLRGETAEYQHHLGEAIGLVDVAEAALLEGTERYLEQAARAVETGHPVDEVGEETRRLLVLEQQCIRLASEAVQRALPDGRDERCADRPPARERDARAHGHAHAHGPAARTER